MSTEEPWQTQLQELGNVLSERPSLTDSVLRQLDGPNGPPPQETRLVKRRRQLNVIAASVAGLILVSCAALGGWVILRSDRPTFEPIAGPVPDGDLLVSFRHNDLDGDTVPVSALGFSFQRHEFL